MIYNVLAYLKNTAARYPDKTAFADEARAITFGELLREAYAVGSALAAVTDRWNGPIAVLADRSADMVSAFMGAVASGNYYVPLDAQMPAARLQSILDLLDPAALLFAQRHQAAARSVSVGCPALALETAAAAVIDEAALNARQARVLDIDPAYAIFTSGSTGVPKGIVVSHRSVIDFVEWLVTVGEFSDKDIMGGQVPFFFDPSVKDLYITMKCGATTHIIPQKYFSFPVLLFEFLQSKNVTALNWSTSAFHLVANSGVLERVSLPDLRSVMVGGETLRAKQLNLWRAALYEAGYTAVFPEDLQAYVLYGTELPEKPVVITFDDGYRDNYLYAYPVLQKYGLKGTIFVIGVSVGALQYYKDTQYTLTPHFTYEEAAEMVDSGVISIGSHTYDMHQWPPFETGQVRENILRWEGEGEAAYREALAADCEIIRREIMNGTGQESVHVMAFPEGEYDTLAQVTLLENGFDITFSTRSGVNTIIKGMSQTLLSMHRLNMTDYVSPEALLDMLAAGE